jgi:hypothetical protein
LNALIPSSISLDEYHAIQAKAMAEKPFQAAVLGAAARWGWLAYHTFDSRRSQPGYPDLHLVHVGLGISLFRELKTMRGRVSPDQQKWLDALAAAGHDVAVWRPSDWFSGFIDEQLFVNGSDS